MFEPSPEDIVAFDPAEQPLLLVFIDTEEEFDWDQRFDSANTEVASIKRQVRAQRILESYDVVPTYMVDYAVASQADGYGPIREFLDDGKCGVGAHLHSWVNPPIEEAVCNRIPIPATCPANSSAKSCAC